MFLPHPLIAIQDNFAVIIRCLCKNLISCPAAPNNLPLPLVVAIHNALSRRIRRFASLVARFRAGRLRQSAPRPRPASAARSPVPGPPTPSPPAPRLSRRRGWLLPLIPNAIGYASQLSHLIAQPDMAELIAAAPSLGRLLRPLARMLAIDLPPAPQRLPRPKTPRLNPPRAKPARPNPAPVNRALPSRRPSIVIGRKRLPRIVFGPG